MTSASSQAIDRTRERHPLLRWVAATAAGALAAGMLVVAGVGAQTAFAGPDAPVVTAHVPQTLILGEDTSVGITIGNAMNPATDTYNLSLTASFPAGAELVGTGKFGAPSKIYEAGDVLPGSIVDLSKDCAALGLEPVPAQSGKCQVPAGTRFAVFQNFSDLPGNASFSSELTLRPKVDKADTGLPEDGFQVGDQLGVVINAYSSNDERLVPVFPGSTGVATPAARAATSGTGNDGATIPVKALRVTKSEPSPENELLRGVHDQTTEYTITVHHTGEGDLSGAVVVDFLPAGLEYLGSCVMDDHTSQANGNGGTEEYTGSGAMQRAGVSPCLDEASIDTIEMTAAIADQYLDADGNRTLVPGKVYTQVTWNVGALSKSRNDAGGAAPTAQPADLGNPGRAASTVIRYRAGIPLFENELFPAGSAPTPGSLEQGANLDNNTGPSTRHGSADSADDAGKAATSWVNLASAAADWTGVTGTLPPATSADHGAEHVEAVDVRVVKRVRVGNYAPGDEDSGWGETASFEQGRIANYLLDLATSEYAGAEFDDGVGNYLLDTMPNGICPAYPASVIAGNSPAFYLGDPRTEAPVSLADFNQKLRDKGLSACQWDAAQAESTAAFAHATVAGLGFDENTGRFFQQLQLDPVDALSTPNAELGVIYSARQNHAYLDAGGEDGATSSGDVVRNTVALDATTTARPEVGGLENSKNQSAGDVYYARDDSSASVHADFSEMTKWVLKNDPAIGVPDANGIWELDYPPGGGAGQDVWTKDEERPFSPGDEVWFKIHWESASGADVRNPVLTDFLPENLTFDENLLDAANEWQDSENLRVYANRNGQPISLPLEITDTCSYTDAEDAYREFVRNVGVSEGGRKLTWELGSTDCYRAGDPSASGDRFWPRGIDLDIYIRATVTNPKPFGDVDISQNLAKYQQNNVEGEIWFLRDQAGIQLDHSARLTKGIRHFTDGVTGDQTPTIDYSYNSNVDGGLAAQGDGVTFRLDVSAPQNGTTDYVLWDALPEGVTKADLAGWNPGDGSFDTTAATVEQYWYAYAPGNPGYPGGIWMPEETTAPAGSWTARAYDPADAAEPGYPAALRSDYANRTIIVWTFTGDSPGSLPEEDMGDYVKPAVAQGFTLGYTVVVPSGVTDGGAPAQLGQEYVNDASIIQLAFPNNTGLTESTLLVNGSDDGPHLAKERTPAPGSDHVYAFDDTTDLASDPSEFEVRGANLTKALHQTEIKPADDQYNSTGTTGAPASRQDDVIVQGEYAEFDVSVTIPAHTTVRDGLLKDDGYLRWTGSPNTPSSRQLAYHLADATVVSPAVLPAGFTLDWDPGAKTGTGALAFPSAPANPEGYTNTSDQPQTFTVRLKVWIDDRDEGNPSRNPDFPDSKLLTNTARFTYTDAEDQPAQLDPQEATVTYREPLVTLEKTVVDPASGVVGADGNVTYRLKAENAAGRPALYDAVVYDCVPSGFTVDAGTLPAGMSVEGTDCSVTGTGAAIRVQPTGGTGTLIAWQVGRIDGGQSPQIDFTVKVNPAAGGGAMYTNSAHVIGHTLPSTVPDPTRRGDRASGASRDVSVASATLDKTVTPTTANVGRKVLYKLLVTLPANANFYDVELSDQLPKGVEYLADSTVVDLDWGGPGAPPQIGVATPNSLNEPAVTPATGSLGQKLDWAIDPTTIPMWTGVRTITVSFSATVTTAVTAASPNNTSTFTWYTAPGKDPDAKRSDPGNAQLTLLNPNVTLQKHVKRAEQGTGSYAAAATGQLDQTFTYRVRLTNTGNTPAYHVRANDVVQPGIRIDTSQAVFTGATFSPSAAALQNGLGGTITWSDLGPISNVSPNNTLDLVYVGSFVGSADLESAASPPASAGTGKKLDNTARVEQYASAVTGGWVYTPGGTRPGGATVPTANTQATAGITPLFPSVVPTKTVTTPVAGQSYGLAYVDQSFNWTLTVRNQGQGTAKDIAVTDTLPANWEYVPGSARLGGQALDDPAITTSAGAQTLVWDETAIRMATAASTPLAASGSFVITFDAKPTAAALTTPGTGVLVRPHTNTLSVTATDVNNALGNKNTASYAGPQSQATAYIARADLSLTKTGAAQPIKAGQSNPAAWKLTVTNEGPDTAEGAITVTDKTEPLPAGVKVTGASGTGWLCTTPVRDAGDDTYSFTCSRTTPNESLANGASFPAIDVAVSVDADQPATTVYNTGIAVPGKTYDPDYVANPGDPGYTTQNNRSRAPLSTTTEADLRLVKTVSSPSPVPTGGVVVGDSITWSLTVTNLGPSDSQSPSANPIRITDQVPTGITDVADPSNASWTATLNGAAWPAGATATAGDQIEWSYVGATVLPANAVSAVTLTGTILTSHTGDVVNTARVHPGPTTDPDYGTPTENNTGSVTTPTDYATTLDVRKSRVVPDATALDGWRQADPVAHPEDAFVAGEPVYYRVTVTNNGPADAHDVQVVDEVPAGLSYDTHANIVGVWLETGGGTTSTGTNASWNTFTLTGPLSPQLAGAANATAFVVKYNSLPTVTGNVVNRVEATTSNWRSSDPQKYDRDEVGTAPTRIVDLGIAKTHTGTGPFTPGTEVEYTMTVTNYGPSATDGVIRIDDALPSGLSYVPGSATVTVPAGTTAPASAEPAQGATAQDLVWNLLASADTFNLNAQITVTYRALIDPATRSGVTLTNAAEVDGPDEEPDPDTAHPNTATDSITTTGTSATMTIAKQVEVSPGVWDETAQKVAGTQVKWRVTVTNSGPSAAPVTFTDALPAGLSLVSVSGTGWDCPAPGGVPTGACSYTANGGLHPVGTANATTIEIVAAIASNLPDSNPPAVPALVNTGTIQWSDDLAPGTHTANDTASITVRTEADLELVKTAVDPADNTTEVTSAVAGEQARYRIDVTNHGPSDAAPDLVVTDTLPLGVSYVGPVGATGTDWDIVASTYDPAVQQTVTFTRIAGTTHIGLPMVGTSPTAAPAILFDVFIDPTLPSTAAPNPRVNTATVVSGTPEPAVDPHPNTDDASLTITRSADLSIVKTHPSDPNGQVHVGDALDFTIQVTNSGPSISSGFEITENVPAGLEVTAVSGVTDLNTLPAAVPGTSWTIQSFTLVDPLDPTGGATVVATYTGTLGVDPGVDDQADPLVISTLVHENALGTPPNHVEITDAEEPDPNPGNDEWDDLIDVTPLVKLVVEKQAVGAFQVGKTGTYRITVENQGPHADPGPIEVTDALPSGLSFHSSPSLPAGATVSVAGKTVTWSLTNGLAVGETATLTLVVKVQQGAYPQVTNTAVAASPSDLTPDSVLSDDATVPVKAADPLAITGGSAVGYLAMLAALLMLAGAVAAATRRKRGAHAE